MAPFNWNQIQSLDLDALEEDEADDWLRELQAVKIEKETDASRLQALFNLCRAVLNIKALQAETAIEEGEKMMRSRTETGNEEARLLQEIDELKEQISTLRRQAGGKDANSLLREEIRDLEEEKHRLTRELLETKQELRHEQEKSEKYSQRLETYEKEVRDLRKERDQLLEDVRDYQRQIQRHRESLSERRVEGDDFQKRMRNRNEEMLKLVNEVNNLAEGNEMLRSQVEELKTDLEECTRQMEKTTDQYSRMKDALSEADTALEALQNENNDLQRQLEKVGVLPATQPSIQDELMEALDKKIEEWKELFRNKEKETESYKKQVEDLQQELIEYRMDSDKHLVISLTKALEERDQQIQLLRKDLTKATKDIDSNADLLEELRNQLSAGGSISKTQKRRMNALESTLKEKEGRFAELTKKAQDAESAAIEKDKQMADLLSRMRQYELGEYGLAEAVDDCRERKVQLDIRNKQAVELTQHCNKLELQTNELMEENDEMRRRLGLDRHAPLDIKFKYAREVERETDRAMNILLQKEVERLEEERLELKLQLRKLSHRIGERAVALGLSSDELMVVEKFMEDLKEKKLPKHSQPEKTRADQDAASEMYFDRSRIQPQPQKLFDDIGRENRLLKTKLAHLETENAKLLQGMKEIRTQLKEAASSGAGASIQMPTLDRLISYMETRELTGNVDAVLQMKSQLDYMTGRNDELRSELRQMTLEMQKAHMELQTSSHNATKLEQELKVWKDVHATGPTLQPIPFPTNMPPTSSLIIANLNEHLIQILHESDLKDQQLRSIEDVIDSYQRKLAILKHQHGLLYRDFTNAKDAWAKETESTNKKLQDMDLIKIEADTRNVEFERLLDTLNVGDQDELKRRLGEMTRKYTVMRINEKKLVRKYAILSEIEERSRKEEEKAKQNALDAEIAVIQKLRHLERHQEMNSYQLSSLYKALEDSIPKADYELLSRQHVEMTEKYRGLLEQESELVKKLKTQDTVQLELSKQQRENDYLKTALLTEKERSIKLELLEEAGRATALGYQAQLGGSGSGSDNDSGVSISELQSVSQRLAVLEMKELNERQRAAHAQMMYEEQRELFRRVEERNLEVERKFEEVTSRNLELQKVERELRDELATCVTRAVNDGDKQRIAQLEKSEAMLRGELDKMKELGEVSRAQYNYLENLQTAKNMELDELRKAVLDMQAESDAKLAVGKLHREIVRLKLAETVDNTDLKLARERLRTLEVQLLRFKTRFDAKDRELRHFRMEYVFRIQQMRRTIASLRERFAGAVPLKSQENFQRTIMQLQSDRERLQQELIQAVEKQHEANDRTEDLALRQANLEELLATLKDGVGAKRVVEWHHKLEEIRLSELKLKRQLARAQEQIQTQSTLISNLELSSAKLEEDYVKITKTWEEREISWENREAELESKLHRYEMQERGTEEELLEVSSGIFGIPDMSLPLTDQLEKALVALRKYITADKVAKQQIGKLNKEIDNMHSEKRKMEAELLRKQRVLLDLRKFVPAAAAANVDSAIAGGWSAQMQTAGSSAAQQNMQKAAQDLLQATVATLKARIDQKDDALEKYRQLLQAAETELNEARREHFEETSRLREQLREVVDRIPHAARQELEDAPEEHELEKQLIRIAELEGTVMSQEHTIGTLLQKVKDQPVGEKVAEIREQLNNLQAENMRLTALLRTREGSPAAGTGTSRKLSVEGSVIKSPNGEDTDEESEDAGMKDTVTIRDSSPTRQTRDSHVQTTEEFPEAPSPNPARDNAPTVSHETHLKLKVRLDRMNVKLKEKEAENKALKRALAELQSGMTAQATARLRPDFETGLRDLERKELKMKIEELESKILRQTKDLRKDRSKTDDLEVEVESLRGELSRKDGTISKLKAEKLKLENEVDSLETRLAHLRESVKLKLQETENREMKKKLATLEAQLRTVQRMPAEKPLEGLAEARSEGVMKWEESKKWQMRLEKLRSKLQAKTREAEEQDKLIYRLKERISRLEQEKCYQDSRTVDKSSTVSPTKRLTPSDSTIASDDKEQNKEPLLEHTNGKQSQLETVSLLEAELSILRSRNSELEHRCAELEAEVGDQRTDKDRVSVGIGTHSARSYSATKDKLSEYAAQEGQSTEEADSVVRMLRNLVEQACAERDQWKQDRDAVQQRLDQERVENQTLLSRVRDIQSELLSANEEIEELREDLEHQPRGMNIEAINRLHGTIEKLENEKAELARQLEEVKLSSARLPDEEIQSIVKENKELKAKLSKTAPRVAWAEQLTAEAKDRKTTIIARENGKLRGELKKLQSQVEKLRADLGSIRGENGRLERELQRLRGMKTWQVPGDGAEAVSHPVEEKEDTALKQSERFLKLEETLKQEIEKSQRQLFENQRLKDKVRALEWAPEREKDASNADYLRQIRDMKVDLANSQSELNELKVEMEAMERRMKPAFDDSGHMDFDVWKERMKIYDRVLHENIELKLECNSLKAKLQDVDRLVIASRLP